MSDPVLVHICQGCDGGQLAELRAAIDRAFTKGRVQIVEQQCMNGCAKPVSFGLQSPGRATCFFAGVDPQSDIADIVATLHAYLKAPRGWIEDARPCGRLRFCLVGRVPAL